MVLGLGLSLQRSTRHCNRCFTQSWEWGLGVLLRRGEWDTVFYLLFGGRPIQQDEILTKLPCRRGHHETPCDLLAVILCLDGAILISESVFPPVLVLCIFSAPSRAKPLVKGHLPFGCNESCNPTHCPRLPWVLPRCWMLTFSVNALVKCALIL